MTRLTRRTTGLMIAAGFLAGLGVAQAKTVSISAKLHPVAGVKTNGTGALHGTYNTATRKVTWTVTYKHLTSPAIMVHFHGPVTAPGQNAPIELWLTKKPPHKLGPGPLKGSATLTAAEGKALMGDHLYLQIHTVDHKPGELRGRIHAGM